MTGYIITERQERIVKQVGATAAREFAAWFGIAYPHTALKLPDNWAARLGEYVYATFKEEIQWRGPNSFTCEWNRAADLAHILANEEMPVEEYKETAGELAKLVLSVADETSAVPYGFLFQHDETGRQQVVGAQEEDGFSQMNPRWHKVGSLHLRSITPNGDTSSKKPDLLPNGNEAPLGIVASAASSRYEIENDHGRRFVWITIDSDHQAIVVDCLRKYADLLQSGTVVDQAGHYYPEDIEHAADRLEAASLAHLLPTLKDEPVAYTIGDHTMEKVFKPSGLTNVHDLQAVFDAVEMALSPPPQSREVGST